MFIPKRNDKKLFDAINNARAGLSNISEAQAHDDEVVAQLKHLSANLKPNDSETANLRLAAHFAKQIPQYAEGHRAEHGAGDYPQAHDRLMTHLENWRTQQSEIGHDWDTSDPDVAELHAVAKKNTHAWVNDKTMPGDQGPGRVDYKMTAMLLGDAANHHELSKHLANNDFHNFDSIVNHLETNPREQIPRGAWNRMYKQHPENHWHRNVEESISDTFIPKSGAKGLFAAITEAYQPWHIAAAKLNMNDEEAEIYDRALKDAWLEDPRPEKQHEVARQAVLNHRAKLQEAAAPSAGLSDEEKSDIEQKAHKGKKVFGGHFHEVEDKIRREGYSKEAAKKIAAAAMWRKAAKGK